MHFELEIYHFFESEATTIIEKLPIALLSRFLYFGITYEPWSCFYYS